MDRITIARELVRMARVLVSGQLGEIASWLKKNAKVENRLSAHDLYDEYDESEGVSTVEGTVEIHRIKIPISVVMKDKNVLKHSSPEKVFLQYKDYDDDDKPIVVKAIDTKEASRAIYQASEDIVSEILNNWIFPQYIQDVEIQMDGESNVEYYNDIGGFDDIEDNEWEGTVEFKMTFKPVIRR